MMLAVSFALGCAVPVGQTREVSENPAIAIQGASATARLMVDGLDSGRARAYDGTESTLVVLPGRHVIEVIDRGKVVLHQVIFVDSGVTKTLVVPKGN
jgi:signal recognition particle receptor subunit beta